MWLWLSKPFWDPILVGIGEFTTHFSTYFSADLDGCSLLVREFDPLPCPKSQCSALVVAMEFRSRLRATTWFTQLAQCFWELRLQINLCLRVRPGICKEPEICASSMMLAQLETPYSANSSHLAPVQILLITDAGASQQPAKRPAPSKICKETVSSGKGQRRRLAKLLHQTCGGCSEQAALGQRTTGIEKVAEGRRMSTPGIGNKAHTQTRAYTHTL